MHYQGMIQDLIQQADRHLKQHKARSIVKLQLNVGDRIDADHFLADLSIFSKGTVLENTEICVSRTAGTSEVILERLELESGGN